MAYASHTKRSAFGQADPTSHGSRGLRRPLNRKSDRLPFVLLAFAAIAVMKVFIHDAHVLKHHDLQYLGRPVLPIVEEDVESVLKFITMKDETEGNDPDEKSRRNDAIDAVNPHSPILPLDKILSRAYGKKKVEKSVLEKLPSVEEVTALYGKNGPVIYGMGTCLAFRKDVPLQRRVVAPAGMYNTGTNLLADLLTKNCVLPHKEKIRGMNWQVPWGKHNPVSWRFHNVAPPPPQGRRVSRRGRRARRGRGGKRGRGGGGGGVL
uniref:Uncharacterized protein n=1 Tax=Corethron hystrix TaxID=216773 RepID=A0A7S1B8E7_9STRA|mmetsp:Transcript_15929/g.35874  ORF Transcript_15929/g.35874 Transcript_15929/m.35874 type:complete len:264 (+) Transcript_15929:82-873(+)